MRQLFALAFALLFSAGATARIARMRGKLKGAITPTTPWGRRRAKLMRPGLLGSSSPCGSVSMPAAS